MNTMLYTDLIPGMCLPYKGEQWVLVSPVGEDRRKWYIRPVEFALPMRQEVMCFDGPISTEGWSGCQDREAGANTPVSTHWTKVKPPA